MKALKYLAHRLMAWFKDVDMETATTWFLLSFVYLLGLSLDAPSVESSNAGILPALRIEMLNATFATLCLVIAAVVLLEPLFPSTLQERAKKVRAQPVWQYIYRFHLYVAFILGLMAGLGVLAENLPTFSWLINAIAYAGFVIIVAMPLKMIVGLWSAMRQQSEKDDG